MKIAMPNNNDMINQHFGRSTSFVIAEINNKEIVQIKKVSSKELTHNHDGLAGLLLNEGVEVVIAGGIGPGALNSLKGNGLEVIKGASGKYEDILKKYINGTLVTKDVVCGHHHGDHHGHNHH